jgi:hypothetical protein
MKQKLPKFKRTFEFYKRLGEMTGFGKIAQISGVCTDTADDWARPVESDDFPTGTGKHNTTETVMRQIRTAHVNDAGFAREWAEVFPAYVDFLDEQAGRERSLNGSNSLCSLIGESAKEHLDIVLAFMKSPNLDHERLEGEILDCVSKLNEMLACVRAEQKKKISLQNGFQTENQAAYIERAS